MAKDLTEDEIAISREDFDQYDVDGSGQLEKSEVSWSFPVFLISHDTVKVRKLCSSLLGRDPAEDEFEAFMGEIDSNQDGIVTFKVSLSLCSDCSDMRHAHRNSWTKCTGPGGPSKVKSMRYHILTIA